MMSYENTTPAREGSQFWFLPLILDLSHSLVPFDVLDLILPFDFFLALVNTKKIYYRLHYIRRSLVFRMKQRQENKKYKISFHKHEKRGKHIF